MSTEVESVPISPALALQRGWEIVAIFAAVVLVSACGSKNQDSLIGMNLDENLAMMNAGEANGAAENVSDTNSASAQQDGNVSDRSVNSVAAKVGSRTGLDAEDRSAELNAAGTNAATTSVQEESDSNDVTNDADPDAI